MPNSKCNYTKCCNCRYERNYGLWLPSSVTTAGVNCDTSEDWPCRDELASKVFFGDSMNYSLTLCIFDDFTPPLHLKVWRNYLKLRFGEEQRKASLAWSKQAGLDTPCLSPAQGTGLESEGHRPPLMPLAPHQSRPGCVQYSDPLMQELHLNTSQVKNNEEGGQRFIHKHPHHINSW